jgi:ribulose-phosphate 3-epimerase
VFVTEQFPIYPSLLAFDFARLADQVRALDAAGAAGFHFDLMDGHFVPNLTFGPMLVAALRPLTRKPLWAHLMVYRPEDYIAPLKDAGANRVYIHPESTPHIHRALSLVRDAGMEAGVALNPGTPLDAVRPVLEIVDGVLMMSVNPGFGGQRFIPATLGRVEALRTLAKRLGATVSIECDGGVNAQTIGPLATAGMTGAVVGTSLFTGKDPAATLRALAQAAR